MTDFDVPTNHAGAYLAWDDPDWAPLARLTEGDDLVLDQFMWMGAIRLDDDRLVHAYKHCDTRCYLHLGEDGTAFEYRGYSDLPYSPVPLGITLREVFCLCRELGRPEEAALRANEALIERHSVHPREVA